jgi:outer membrane protein OmpA-like peptidoglycan-associated protein
VKPRSLLLLCAVSSAAACVVLASCAFDKTDSPPAAPLRPTQVAQADDGRFQACIDCGQPTPKTAGRPAIRPVVQAVVAPRSPATADLLASTPSTQAPPAKRSALRLERVSIPFDSGSAELSAGALARLQQVMPMVSKAQSVRAVGFTDDQGEQGANDRLATARALAVMVKLRRLIGEKSSPELTADGRGKCCYLNDNRVAADRALNRRVELVLRFEDTVAVDQLVSRFQKTLDGQTGRPASRPVATQVGAIQ